MTQAGPDTRRSGRRWHRWRVVGSAVGLLLLAAAIWLVVSRSGELAQAWAALKNPHPQWIAMLVLGVVGAIPTSAVAQSLMLRRTSGVWVPLGEMSRLVTVSTLLNMLPLWPGALGRIGYHRLVHGVPPMRAGIAVVSVRLIGSATGLVMLAGAWAVGGSTVLVSVGWACVLAGFLLVSIAASTRLASLAAAAMWIDLGWSMLRYVAAFALLGQQIDVGTAGALAGTASVASSIPFIGGAPGLREWSVGWMTARLEMLPDALALGLLADLLVRGATLVVLMPIGIVMGRGLSRRLRTAVKAAVPLSPPSDRSPDPRP